jgi:hypothetical protein
VAPVKPRYADALTRDCPTCHAPPDHPCTTRTGTPAHPPHAARQRLPGTPAPFPGRTPVLLTDPKVQKRLLRRIRKGVTIRIACAAAGIGETTLYRWLEEADDPQSPDAYREFREALTRARAEGAARLIERIDDASKWSTKSEKTVVITQGPRAGPVYGPDGKPLVDVTWERDWKAAAWLLERQFSADYGKRETVTVNGDGLAVEVPASAGVSVPGVNVEVLRRIQQSLRDYAADRGLEIGHAEVVDAEIVDG